MDLSRDFERTNESMSHFAVVLLRRKTKSRSDASSYVTFWGNGRKKYKFHFVEWKNTTLILLQWLWASVGLHVRANAECFVILMLWIKGDCKILKRSSKFWEKVKREKVRKERKRYIMGSMSKWALWIYLWKNNIK